MMENYLDKLIIAALVCGLVMAIGDKLQGGFDKLLCGVCSLVLAFFLIYPVVSLLQREDFPNIPDLTVLNYSNELVSPQVTNENDSDVLIERSEKELEKQAKKMIKSRFSLSDDDFSVEFRLMLNGSSLEIGEATVRIYSLKSLSRRDEIVRLIEDGFYISPNVIEEVS